MAQFQEMWQKLNANERLVSYGAIIVLVAWLVGLIGGGGFGYGIITAILVLVIYWLKYAPNQNVTWPLPVPTLVLLITGISALLVVLTALPLLGALGFFYYGGIWVLAFIAGVIGVIVMAYGAWREYQAAPKTPAAPPPPPPPAA
ncbi:MAG TPA: hypothetical protein VGQ85_06210 [Candidatus Limnocylindrales bacterium]|nr:hypothetical protein [Candidatus Limnocylindrales bacterium]